MKQTFLTKVSYTKQFDNGTFKRVVEQYLFDGHTFTDCEANVYTHLGSMIKGEFTIMKMDKFMVDEIIGDKENQFEKFFLVKQIHTDIDDREIKMKMLVNAPNIERAKDIAMQYNAEVFMFEPEINSIVETKILDYFQSETENLEA
jgi:hypothetical protein